MVTNIAKTQNKVANRVAFKEETYKQIFSGRGRGVIRAYHMNIPREGVKFEDKLGYRIVE